MNRACRAAIALLFALLIAPAPCRADGTVYRYDRESGLLPSTQYEQHAAIFFDGGRERLIISCQLRLDRSAQAIWIVPVPRDPGGCRVDVVDKFPRFSGRTIRSEFKAQINGAFGLMAATQILPIPLLLASAGTLSASRGGDQVAVDSIVDRYGMHCEAVSADSVEALLTHVRSRNVKAEAADFEPFRDYLDPSWSLVIAWISSAEEAREHFRGDRFPCISAEFGTARPFYPMKPTARAYGNLKDDALGVKVLVWVRGLWNVDCSASLREKLKIEYFHGGPRLEDDSGYEDGAYTRILSAGHISGFTEDFYLSPDIPLGMRACQGWLRLPDPWKLACLVTFNLLYSLLVGMLANLLVLGRGRGAWWIGLCNIGTIIAVWLAMSGLRLEAQPAEAGVVQTFHLNRNSSDRLSVIRWYVITFILLYSLPLLLPALVL